MYLFADYFDNETASQKWMSNSAQQFYVDLIICSYHKFGASSATPYSYERLQIR